eukprot:4857854-Amphidinium_carterae.1
MSALTTQDADEAGGFFGGLFGGHETTDKPESTAPAQDPVTGIVEAIHHDIPGQVRTSNLLNLLNQVDTTCMRN